MRKLNVQMLFDAICDCVLHEHSTKEVLRAIDERRGPGSGDIRKIIGFVQDERRNRGLHPLDFAMKPEGMKLGWHAWNSGGGCMIWSCDLADGKSVHLSDDCCVLADCESKAYLEIADWEEQALHMLADCDMNDIAQGRDINFLFCPYVGQEMADLILADVNIIVEFL